MQTFNIPQQIKVGFNKRNDTYTGKLGFITYINLKGETAQQTSWDSWRDHNIPVMEFDNKPSRFVFNKGVQRSAGHFGSGRSMVRIYDERDFEFEISVENMMDILMHSDVSKRDITEECVFAWNGTKVYLLPVNSEEYQKAVVHTEKQKVKFSLKDLKSGLVYELKKNKNNVTYIGYYHFFDCTYSTQKYLGKSHVFYGPEYPGSKNNVFQKLDSKDIGYCLSDDVSDQYPTLLTQFMASKNYKNKAIVIKKSDNGTKRFVKAYNSYGEYRSIELTQKSDGSIEAVVSNNVTLKTSSLTPGYLVNPSRYAYNNYKNNEMKRDLQNALSGVTDMNEAKTIMFKEGFGQIDIFEN